MQGGPGQRLPRGQDTPPAVVVHGLAEAMAALALAGPGGVALLSAPGAAGSLGPGWFLALVVQAAAARPGVPHRAILDCADAPGQALAALRAGLGWLVLDPGCPGFAAVVAAAAERNAVILQGRPPALDLGSLDLRRTGAREKVAAWLTTAR
jgi:hypothetical protein